MQETCHKQLHLISVVQLKSEIPKLTHSTEHDSKKWNESVLEFHSLICFVATVTGIGLGAIYEYVKEMIIASQDGILRWEAAFD